MSLIKLMSINIEAVPRQFETGDWITVVLLMALCLVTMVKLVYPFQFRRFSKVLFAYNYLFDNSVEKDKGFGYMLLVAHLLILSLGLYFLNLNYPILEDMSVISFLKLFLIYTVFVVGKYLIEKMMGVIFSIEEVIGNYVNYKITIKNFFALILFPILLLVAYAWHPSFRSLAVIFWFFVSLNLAYLGVYYEKTRMINKSNWYYIILYLCAFEIAPYFILYKVIV